jgi:hypothetical protein
LLDYMGNVCLFCEKLPIVFSEHLCHFAVSLARYESFSSSASLPALNIIDLVLIWFYFSSSSRYGWNRRLRYFLCDDQCQASCTCGIYHSSVFGRISVKYVTHLKKKPPVFFFF